MILNQTAFAGTLEAVNFVNHFEKGIAPSLAKAYV